jgi:hypothetical protein
MKKLAFLFFLFPAAVYADDKMFDCSKKKGLIECKVLKDGVSVHAVSLNGGECNAPHSKIHHTLMKKGDKFTVPGSRECYYVRKVSITTHEGKKQTFLAL